jgi:hypothetical protein
MVFVSQHRSQAFAERPDEEVLVAEIEGEFIDDVDGEGLVEVD